MRDTKTTRTLYTICRCIVGLVFLFSGFVKGVDPMGTAYKIQEYMTAWSIGSFTFEWALPLALPLSMTMITLELTVGMALLLGAWRRVTAIVLLIMMVFFTVTTLIDVITNKVTDCGCFGDFIKLTNWQTFLKNVILDVPTVVIVAYSGLKHRKHFERDTLIIIVMVVTSLLFQWWNIKNEPCIDFRPWKVGNQMIPFDENLETQSYVTYRNKTTGEVNEFLSSQLMDYYSDSTWRADWEFVDSRVVDPYEIKADGFCMLGPDDEDYATDIVGSDDYVMIATIYHANDVSQKGWRALRYVHELCLEKNINMVLLTSSVMEDIQPLLHSNNLDELVFYTADETAIKTMLRSNPGFILLKNAKVMEKWSLANATDVADFPFELNY